MTTFVVDAILFDMDGTLVDSTAGVLGAWKTFAESYPGIDVGEILSCSHGVRTVDNLRRFCGIQDPDLLEQEAHRFELAIVETSGQNNSPGIVSLPGVAEAMAELCPARHLPKPRWAICTSATRAYASSALQKAGVPVPDVFVTAEDVVHGKPRCVAKVPFNEPASWTSSSPDPYLLGAEKCGYKPESCIVFEDAPSGVRSGQAAGCKTIALLTTHSRDQLEAAKPDYIIKDMACATIELTDEGVRLTLDIEA
ncbi:HAD-like domain containing protein [Amanita muscaria]